MLLYLFLLIFCALLGFRLYSRKWSSNYQLYFLFGLKGAGKTSLMAKKMLRYMAAGYTIYTDIEGVQIPGVRLINVRDLSTYKPVPKCAIFLDEIGLSQNNRDFKNFDAGLREFYAKSRHFQAVIWANSQSFDADKWIRNRTDRFFFCQKIAGCISLARPIVQVAKPNDMTSPNCDSPVLQYYKWGKFSQWQLTWLPKYARLFDSFSVPDREEIAYTATPGDPLQGRKAAKRFLRHLNRQASHGR